MLAVVDYAILVVVAFSTIVGFFRGAIREVFSLIALVVAVGVTLQHDAFLGKIYPHVIINPAVDPAVVKLVVFVAILIIFAMVGQLIHHVIGVLGAGFFDHLFGGLLGFIRAIFLSVFCITFLSHALQTPLWKKSLLFPPISHLNCQLIHSSGFLDKAYFLRMCRL